MTRTQARRELARRRRPQTGPPFSLKIFGRSRIESTSRRLSEVDVRPRASSLLAWVLVMLSLTASAHEPHHHGPQPVKSPAGTRLNAALYAEKVEPIFRQKCFDCHSRETRYPWYYRLPIAKQVIDHDVREGREHLDMTDGFPFAGHHTPEEQAKGILEVLDRDSMPPWRYRLLHPGTHLTEAEKRVIRRWIGQ